MEKISVIIPCYNAEQYIGRCLSGLEKQTYGIDNLEIILIDDSSADGTYEQLLQFEKEHSQNVIVVHCEDHVGPGSARNIGMEYATGEYLSFVDADDVMDHSMLRKMYDAMISHECEVVGCNYKLFMQLEEICKEKTEEDYFLQSDTADGRQMLILTFFKTAVWGRLYRRSFLLDNKINFPEGIEFGEDNFFSGLVMLMCSSYYHIGDTLYYYFSNTNGIVNKNNDTQKVMQLDAVMKLFLNELWERELWESILDECGQEFEWYMIYKYFLDPVRLILNRTFPGWQEQIQYCKSEILKIFPDAYLNVYLKSGNAWETEIALLADRP